MSLHERIVSELKDAMRSREELRTSVLRMLSAALHNREIERRKSTADREILNDEEIIQVIRSELKKRIDAEKAFELAGRSERAVQEGKEALILRSFLPSEFSDDELILFVRRGISETGAKDEKDSGKVVGWVMREVRGSATGERVLLMAKRELGHHAT